MFAHITHTPLPVVEDMFVDDFRAYEQAADRVMRVLQGASR